jgi:hypothetical protein
MDADDETKNIRTDLCGTLLKTSDILKPKDEASFGFLH